MFGLVPFRRRNRDLFEVNDFFEDFFNNFGSFALDNAGLRAFWTDIKETDDEYVIYAELPGVNKDDIHIEVDENYMTITASNNQFIEEEKDNYIRRERRCGRFQRSFNISDVDPDRIQAKYENGILEVKLPKTNKTKSARRIDIN